MCNFNLLLKCFSQQEPSDPAAVSDEHEGFRLVRVSNFATSDPETLINNLEDGNKIVMDRVDGQAMREVQMDIGKVLFYVVTVNDRKNMTVKAM